MTEVGRDAEDESTIFLTGSPVQVRDRLKRRRDQTGLSYFVVFDLADNYANPGGALPALPGGEFLPQYGGIRSPHYAWWRYDDGFEEMYDLRNDPYQLVSVSSDPAYAHIRNRMIAKWERLRDCSGKTCKKRSRTKSPL